MDRAAALDGMRDAVGLWYVGHVSAADVVYAACDLLVAGLDGPSLAMLASVSVHQADDEVAELLEAALRDVGLVHHPKGSRPACEAGLRVMAARVVSGDLAPIDMASWAHTTFGHDTCAAAEPFVDLDDAYEINLSIGMPCEDLDARVRAEARRLLERPDPLSGS